VEKYFRFLNSSTLLIILLGGGTVKNFICVFALVAIFGLLGCAGLKGKGASHAAGESQLGKGAFQKMEVTCWGFCSIAKGNSK